MEYELGDMKWEVIEGLTKQGIRALMNNGRVIILNKKGTIVFTVIVHEGDVVEAK